MNDDKDFSMMYSPSRRVFGYLLFPLLLGALVLLPARKARADASGAAVGVAYIAMVTLLGTAYVGGNGAFTIHDAIAAGDREPPPPGWLIGETLFAAPQSIYCNGVLAWAHGSGTVDESARLNLMILPAIWSSQMATHGIWSLALEERPTYFYGFSWAIGANLTFTSGALGAAFGKRLGGTVFGLAEMAGTAPTIIVGLSQFAKETLPEKSAWVALTSWSGALFVHGAISTVVGFTRAKNGPKKNPESNEAALRFAIAPMLVSDGLRRVPGLGAGGVF